MKAIITTMIMALLLQCLAAPRARAQEEELQQLALNLQKLNQFRAILTKMYEGYQILTQGYNTVKNLAEKNFSIHKVFMDGLMAVSPTVHNYQKVAAIVSYQKDIVRDYKAALNEFGSMNIFDASHLQYIEAVYDRLFDRSLEDLDELLMIITASQLQMNDAERIAAIDRIYASVSDQRSFLRHFNVRTKALADQKLKNKRDLEMLQQLHGIPQP
jgi:hypothetical protein